MYILCMVTKNKQWSWLDWIWPTATNIVWVVQVVPRSLASESLSVSHSHRAGMQSLLSFATCIATIIVHACICLITDLFPGSDPHHCCPHSHDDDDIVAVTRDMCRKANCILHTFSSCDPVVKTNLYSGVFVFLSTVVVFGRYHLLWSVHLKLPSTISWEEFGLYLTVVTRASYTRLLVCIACTTPFLTELPRCFILLPILLVH